MYWVRDDAAGSWHATPNWPLAADAAQLADGPTPGAATANGVGASAGAEGAPPVEAGAVKQAQQSQQAQQEGEADGVQEDGMQVDGGSSSQGPAGKTRRTPRRGAGSKAAAAGTAPKAAAAAVAQAAAQEGQGDLTDSQVGGGLECSTQCTLQLQYSCCWFFFCLGAMRQYCHNS